MKLPHVFTARAVEWRRVGMFIALASLLPTGAQADGFDVQQLTPAFGPRVGYHGTQAARLPGHLDWEVGTLIHHDDDPLVAVDENGDRNARVVDSQTTQHFMGTIGVLDWFQLGVDVPLILSQSGEALEGYPVDGSQAGLGLGDVRLGAKAAIFGRRHWTEGGLAAAVALDAWLPTGSVDDFQGDGAARVEPALIVEYLSKTSGRRYAVNVSYLNRQAAPTVDIVREDGVNVRAGAAIPLSQDLFVLPEVLASIPAGESEGAPPAIELMGGARYAIGEHLLVGGGAAAGVVPGLGTPDWRAFAMVSYGSFARADIDPDLDGIVGRKDSCPHEAEDIDDWQDDDGCADLDNDGDGIADVDDPYPMTAEDLDGFEDEDGIPDPDNDGDGVLDVVDAAPMVPEDLDGFEDEDGAPEWDNDLDGRTDDEDLCPMEPELYNGIDDMDGCPDDGGLINLTCDAVEVLDKVYFGPGKAAFLPRSTKLLDQVAGALNAATFVGRIYIDGHADEVEVGEGGAHQLTEKRANKVRDYLVSQGVDEARIEVRGMGAQWPVSQNETKAGRSLNRRVEFIVIDPLACQASFNPRDVWGQATDGLDVAEESCEPGDPSSEAPTDAPLGH